jgi:hypothetical protein
MDERSTVKNHMHASPSAHCFVCVWGSFVASPEHTQSKPGAHAEQYYVTANVSVWLRGCWPVTIVCHCLFSGVIVRLDGFVSVLES